MLMLFVNICNATNNMPSFGDGVKLGQTLNIQAATGILCLVLSAKPLNHPV